MKDREKESAPPPSEPLMQMAAASQPELISARNAFNTDLDRYSHRAIHWSQNGALAGLGIGAGSVLLARRNKNNAATEFSHSVRQGFQEQADDDFSKLEGMVAARAQRALGLKTEALQDVVAASKPLFESIRAGKPASEIEASMGMLQKAAAAASHSVVMRGVVRPALVVLGSSVACAAAGNQLFQMSHHADALECTKKRLQMEELQRHPQGHTAQIESRRAKAEGELQLA